MAIAPGLKRKGGLFGSAPMMARPGEGMAAAQEPAKPKFFGEGGVGRAIAGNVGDFLLQYSGMDPIYAPAMQQRQAMVYDQQQRERSRLADWQDKIAFAKWERDNPRPTQPHRWERNDGSLMEIGPDGSPRVAYEDPTPKMMFLPDGAGGGRWVAQPGITAPAQGGAPKTLPSTFDGWDADEAPPISAAPQRPNTIARSAYQAWVNQYGQQEADNIMRRNGFTVGNY